MKMSWGRVILSVVLLTAVTATSAGYADELGTEPFTFQEGLNAVGYPGRFGVATGGLKVAIVDGGFHGIDEWLTQNGDKAASVFKRTKISNGSDHGFKVFQVAQAVIPDAKFYLYETDLALSNAEFTDQMSLYVQDMAGRGVDFVNLSIGIGHAISPYYQGPNPILETMELFRKHEVFALFSSGNERRQFHSWTVSAAEKGYIKFTGADGTDSFAANVLPSQKNILLGMFWEAHPDDPPVTVSLQQEVDGKFRTFIKAATNGEMQLTYRAEQDEPSKIKTAPGQIYIEVDTRPLKDAPFIVAIDAGDAAEKFYGRRMTLYVNGARFTVPGGQNGRDSHKSHAQYENPYVMFVGAFAKTKDGKVAPAVYSSYGMTPSGSVIPHVMGPGTFTFPNGKVGGGTSYAAPFITAVLAGTSMQHFNPKNVAERISSFDFLTANPAGPDRGRYGVPNGGLLLNPAKLNQILSPNSINGIAHRVDGEDLVFSGKISRCCMEGIDAQAMVLVGQLSEDGGQPKLTPINGAVGATTFTTGAKDYDAAPVEIRIPLSVMPPNAGRFVAQFAIRKTKSGSDPFQIPSPEPYIFTLP